MPTLKEAIKKAVKKRKIFGSPKKKASDPNQPGYFEVEMEFDVIAKYRLKEMVMAKDATEAEANARIQFMARDDQSNIQTGKQFYRPGVTMANPTVGKVIKKAKPQLSDNQKFVLQKLAEGDKLYPGGRWGGNSYTLKSSKDSKVAHGYVSKVTVTALWRKGFITTPELLMAGDTEIIMQKALGTLLKGALVINTPQLEEYRINILLKKGK